MSKSELGMNTGKGFHSGIGPGVVDALHEDLDSLANPIFRPTVTIDISEGKGFFNEEQVAKLKNSICVIVFWKYMYDSVSIDLQLRTAIMCIGDGDRYIGQDTLVYPFLSNMNDNYLRYMVYEDGRQGIEIRGFEGLEYRTDWEGLMYFYKIGSIGEASTVEL